ncbi:1-acyl-sn-glycerol-3-phosphate acyltransferase [Mariprofundus ferrinatatus]|uniref:1-acyl-sn-glycerol-3-phosphate acyltransferase n=1 Tax=Mariprofundus ferrinatatus TaxID=1921087 RepID=A0A2K8L210_9PROT|nr:lysophospholipid acyltransferase family protein [Mariprofundus ferrinatatus]ATX81355.1 1-acyl-sn-glycerol-3-phosphate acyltransferase [Mariprofundus ferrinatatus]
MLAVRSALFNACFMILTPLFSLLVILFRPFGFSASWFWAKLWSNTIFVLLRLLCAIRIKIEGREHLPEHACVVVAKHQSAAETVAMPILVPPYTWILKRELFNIPFFGWALALMGTIGIRRGSPREAIKQVISDGSKKLDEGRWVVIFPEGTRSAVGTAGNYQPGGVILAHKAEVGILPLAHNAGALWPKRGFIKKPGTITFRFLPYIPADEVKSIHRNELLKRLQNDIEAATRELGG